MGRICWKNLETCGVLVLTLNGGRYLFPKRRVTGYMHCFDWNLWSLPGELSGKEMSGCGQIQLEVILRDQMKRVVSVM